MRWVLMGALICTGCLKPPTCVELLQCSPDGEDSLDAAVRDDGGELSEADSKSDSGITGVDESMSDDGAASDESAVTSHGAQSSDASALVDASNDETATSWPVRDVDAGNTTSPATDGSSSSDAPEPPRVVQLVAGGHHTCVLSNLGTVRCWGAALYGQLGYGNTDKIGDDETPASAGDVDVGGSVARLYAGWTTTCALLRSGGLRCWGQHAKDMRGYAGPDPVGDDEAPASLPEVDVGGVAIDLALGFIIRVLP